MSIAIAEPSSPQFGPYSAGIHMTPAQFDRADFEEGWRYELINGVLVVSPTPLEQERDPNDELGHWLRTWKEIHPLGHLLDTTLPEHTIAAGDNRRRADRAIWIGLGRRPTKADPPSIIAEFVSKGKRAHFRDYVEKRDEYMAIDVKEYWIFDRFARTLTVFRRHGKKVQKLVVTENQIYETPLLPDFELLVGKLLELADAWTAGNEE